MGAYRSKPEKDKIYESGGNDSIHFASCSMQGWRIHQEDAHNCIVDFMPKMSFFAVYDGHGGPEVAQYLSLHFPDYLKNLQILDNFDSENLPTLEEIQNVLRQAFLQFDESLTSENVFEKLSALKGDGSSQQQKDSPKTEREEQDELMAEAIELSKESRISLDKIIKRYTKYKEFLKNSAKEEEEKEGVVEEESEQVVEWSNERSSRRTTKRSVMLFNSPPQIPKRIKLCGERSDGVTEEERVVDGTSKNCEETSEDKKEKNEEEQLAMDKEILKNNKKEGVSPTNGKLSDKEGMLKMDEEGKEQNYKSKTKKEEEELKNVKAVHLVATKEEELVLPALEEFEVSSSTSTTTMTKTTTQHSIVDDKKIKTQQPKKKTATSPIKEEEKNKGQQMEEEEEGPSSSSSNLEVKNHQGIAQLLQSLDEGGDNNDEEDSDYKVEEDEEGDVADSTSNEVEDEEVEDEEIDEEEDDSLIEEDLNSLMMRTGNVRAGFDSGSTACVTFVLKNHLIVANVGDTRAVLCRSKKAVDLSVDHKPEDDIEKERINAAGGHVSSDGRVNGGLNLSRAFGDHCYKQGTDLPLHSQQITAFPDITVTNRDFENDDFLVVACDGIWNSLTSQQVCDFILERINRIGLKEIVAEICDYCCANDTDGDGTGCDNETIILIDLKKERPLSPQVSSSSSSTLLNTEQENNNNNNQQLNTQTFSSSSSNNNNTLTKEEKGISPKNEKESQNNNDVGKEEKIEEG